MSIRLTSCGSIRFYTPQQKQKDAPYERSPAISGVRSSNEALLCRYKSAKHRRSHISPTASKVINAVIVHWKITAFRLSFSICLGVTHYTLQARSCARGIPLTPFRGYGNMRAGTASPCVHLPLILF